ncbi:MAG: glycoside hydrolase [Pedobacter sp.]|nr:MAG: glycoside hydrolase [Pedobacter sp.]
MELRIIGLLIGTCLWFGSASAKDYKVDLFKIQPDGQTLNTKSIQFAIDHISGKGGGRLVFPAGRYLTGSIYLKSNVTLQLEEGAVLLGSLNPFDYEKKIFTALVFAYDQNNIGVTGRGTIDGQGKFLARNIVTAIEKGLIEDLYTDGRATADNRAMLLNFRNCTQVLVRGITLKNSASWTQTYDQCINLVIDSIKVDNTVYWNEDGVDIVDCEHVRMTNSFIDAADDGICLKSHDPGKACRDILISNNIIRSSANGIKFGTVSRGGFVNVRILNNKVYDTYRSAVALEAVDGGYIEDIEINGLQSVHTGNIIFLRTGGRWGKNSRMKNIRISNVTGDIPATKPDAGYEYEGPIEDLPRNISPGIIITGLSNAIISNVVLDQINFTHAGGGNALYANVPLDKLNIIPELPAKYPDFSMFKELPSWGIFIRHAADVKVSNLSMVCERQDFRMPIVLEDVKQASFSMMKLTQEGKKKDVFQNNSTGILIK